MSQCEVHFPEKMKKNFITNDFLTTDNHQNVNICWKILKFLLFVIVSIILIGCLSCLIHLEKSDSKIFLVVRNKKSIQVQKTKEFTLNQNDSGPEIPNPVINTRINPTIPQDAISSPNREKTDEKMKNVEKGLPLGLDSLLNKTQTILGNIHENETSEKISTLEAIPYIFNPPHRIFNPRFLNRPTLFDIFERILRQNDGNRITESQNIESEKRIHLPIPRKIIIFKQRTDQKKEIKNTEKPYLLNNLLPKIITDKPSRFIPFNFNQFSFINSLSHFPNKLTWILPKPDNYESDPESEDSEDGKIKMMDSRTDSESDESQETLGKMINNRRFIYRGLPITLPKSERNFNSVNLNSKLDENQPVDSQPVVKTIRTKFSDAVPRFNSEESFGLPFRFRFRPASSEETDKSQNYFPKFDSKSSQDISESENSFSSEEYFATDNHGIHINSK